MTLQFFPDNQNSLFSQSNAYKIITEKEQAIINKAAELFKEIENLDNELKIEVINQLKIELHKISPFKNEPVDLVLWVRNETVFANDYNPNSVAPPEMKLLAHSITEDGYTQPIVSFLNEEKREVVDGFHRNRVGKEIKEVRERVLGYLPVVTINESREDKGDRIAATIRHNRARGKHKIEAMSDIVIELKRRNWSDEKIGRELGMDADEVLRLTQITGLAEMFADKDFSQAWEAELLTDSDTLDIIQEIEDDE
jgi:ParB-like chromosome segregation protein Spo0J